MSRIKDHLHLTVRYIRKKPLTLTAYIATSIIISICASKIHSEIYTVGTRILVEDTSRYSSILSGYYTPKSNIKETIENLKEATLSKEFIYRAIEKSKILQNWEQNKPQLYHFTSKILEIAGKSKPETEKETRLIAFVRKRTSFYRENNTIIIHFDWHNKVEAKSYIDSLQSQIIEKNKSDQKSKSKSTINVLTSIKNEVDSSILKITSKLEDLSISHKNKQSNNETKKIKILGSKKAQLISIEEKISAYERKRDEIDIDAEHTISKLRNTLGPKHPDLKLAIQAAEQKATRTSFISQLHTEKDALINEIQKIESILEVSDTLDENKNTPEVENSLNELRLLSIRRQELEERIDDAKKSLLSIDGLLANTLTITDPPVTPKRPSSKSTFEITLFIFLMTSIGSLMACYFHGLTSDTILSDFVMEKRHLVKKL